MNTNTNDNNDTPLDQELSSFWYCPFDNNILQERQSRVAQNPNFFISRGKIDIGVNNAIAMKKIPPEAANHTAKIANYIFNIDRSKRIVELVSVTCKMCGKWFSAPRLSKIDGVGIPHVHSILVDRARPAYLIKPSYNNNSPEPVNYSNSTNCQNCYRENDAKYSFCIHCGAKITQKDFKQKSPLGNNEDSCAHCKGKFSHTKGYLINDAFPGKKFCSPKCGKDYIRMNKKD